MARVVLYDACVLYPAPLRDLLMRLALTDLFQARWTDATHDEWIRSVLSDRPDIRPEGPARCRELMDRHVPDCLVVGFEPLLPTFSPPDPDDRHVLAAAIHAQAEVIVTFNLGDFPASVLGGFGIEAVHPDEVITRLCDESSAGVIAAARLHRASLKKPAKAVAEYLASLEQCRLPETVTRLRMREDEVERPSMDRRAPEIVAASEIAAWARCPGKPTGERHVGRHARRRSTAELVRNFGHLHRDCGEDVRREAVRQTPLVEDGGLAIRVDDQDVSFLAASVRVHRVDHEPPRNDQPGRGVAADDRGRQERAGLLRLGAICGRNGR
jgi:hypothetical protein